MENNKFLKAKEKLNYTYTDLAVRKDNFQIGSGLGGNQLLLLILLHSNVKLIDSDNSAPITYESNSNTISIQCEWLNTSSLKEIRQQLDSFVEKFLEGKRASALEFESLFLSNNLRATIEKNKDKFSKILSLLDKDYLNSSNENISDLDLVLVTSIKCEEFLTQLKSGQTPDYEKLSNLFKICPEYIYLLVTRNIFSLENIIRYNLDLVNELAPHFKRVNSLMMDVK